MSILSQRSLAGGELGPSLYARCDTTKYSIGLRTQRNFITMRHGGDTNRPGFAFTREVKFSDKSVRLIPFIFSTDQAYVLEFGDEYIRFIKNNDYLKEAAKNITAITKANPGVVTSNSHGYVDGETVDLGGILGMTQLNGKTVVIRNETANTYEMEYLDGTVVDTSAFGTYVSGGTSQRIYEIVSPYDESDLRLIKYTQRNDIMILTHPEYEAQQLSRAGELVWTIDDAPTVAPDTGGFIVTASAQGTTGSTVYKYCITGVLRDGTEMTWDLSIGPVFQITNGNATLSLTNYNQMSIAESTGYEIEYFNVYKEDQSTGRLGFIAEVSYDQMTTSVFKDTGYTPDTTEKPPAPAFPLENDDGSSGTTGKPEAAIFFQQRLLLGGSDFFPERFDGSKINQFNNFSKETPIAGDSPISITLAGRRLNRIHHMADIGGLALFTSDGQWGIRDALDASEVPNMKQFSYNPSSRYLAPIIVDDMAIYCQSRGSIVRDLGFNFDSDGYRGNDLTIFAPHLFKNKQLMDWGYQQTPHSILWIVRNDGTMIALTYIREQQIWAWHRHDTDGSFENTCVIPEGDDDVLYVVVQRDIDGRSVRYIERMSSLNYADVIDAAIMDSHISYDGRNVDPAKTMTLTGGTDWDENENLTLNSSFSYFVAGDVGNAIHYAKGDELIRLEITAFTDADTVTVVPHKTVPVNMRNVALNSWAKAVDELAGLDHLEGKTVSIFADRFVVASPNNPKYTSVYTVTNGQLTLDAPYAVIHVGLPITSDIETLDIDTPNGETIQDKNKLVQAVNVRLEESRGLFAAAKAPATDSVDGFQEFMIRDEEGYEDPVSLLTGVIEVTLDSSWNSNGRVFIRQVDPIPMTILSIAPAGMYPFTGGG